MKKKLFCRILTGCYDNTVNIWTIKGTHKLTIPGHTAPVKAVTWIDLNEHRGVFASTSQDQTAMIWEWNILNNSVDCVYVCKGHDRGVDSVAINPAGKLMGTGGWDTMLKIWSSELHETSDETASKKSKSEGGRTRVSA